MRLAILGATSNIAKDLIDLFLTKTDHQLFLFSRNKEHFSEWIKGLPLNYACRIHNLDYSQFLCRQDYEALINFVGVGDPAKAVNMGSSIFDITNQYDELCLAYQQINPSCRYLFMSSGAAYGSNFEQPASIDSRSVFPINSVSNQDWYGLAKMHAEIRHRARQELSITDLRVFSYFSRSQNINARFLLSDAARAIIDRRTLLISDDPMERDYIHPEDLFQLISLILGQSKFNEAIDCYSKNPVSKMQLIEALVEKYGLKVEISSSIGVVNATGSKKKYFSLNKRAQSIGYLPKYGSLEGILVEMDSLLKQKI